MWKHAALLVVGAALIGSTSPQTDASPQAEARLARLLEGRVAGEPVSCLKFIGQPETKVVGDAAILYGSGKTIYVNRTHSPGKLGSGDKVSLADVMCEREKARVYRSYGYFDYGLPVGARDIDVQLAEFIPYRRVDPKK